MHSAKKLPALRYTHARYDDYVEEAKKTDKDGLNAWEREKQQLKLFDTWLNWQDKMPDDCNVQHPLIQHVIRRWPMPESFAEVIGFLPVRAESCWPVQRTRSWSGGCSGCRAGHRSPVTPFWKKTLFSLPADMSSQKIAWG